MIPIRSHRRKLKIQSSRGLAQTAVLSARLLLREAW